MILPTEPGFYWAQWRRAAAGTRDGDELTPSDTWGVVEVWENSLDIASLEYLMVSVPGVERAQAIDGFVWAPDRIEMPFAAQELEDVHG